MSNPYIGEIRMFAGNFAPAGWAFCNGQLIAISENEFLFSLIGTRYGGDGEAFFGLPDLRGRLPMHQGNGRTMGEPLGVESVVLSVAQIPSHTHAPACSSQIGNQASPVDNVWAPASTGDKLYTSVSPAVAMNAQALSAAGGGQPHDNMMPYLAISFIISLFGLFPTRN
jgi:microcystin-dependent protein